MSTTLLYVVMVAGGVGVESLGSKLYYRATRTHLRKNHFSFGRYLYLLLFPLLGTLIVANIEGMSIFKVFILFALIGPIFEWLVGYSYYQLMGVRLWTYKRFTYQGHTSLLTIPLWGMAGVLFYLLSRSFS